MLLRCGIKWLVVFKKLKTNLEDLKGVGNLLWRLGGIRRFKYQLD